MTILGRFKAIGGFLVVATYLYRKHHYEPGFSREKVVTVPVILLSQPGEAITLVNELAEQPSQLEQFHDGYPEDSWVFLMELRVEEFNQQGLPQWTYHRQTFHEDMRKLSDPADPDIY